MKTKIRTIALLAFLTFGVSTLHSCGGEEEESNTEESHEGHDHDEGGEEDHEGHDH